MRNAMTIPLLLIALLLHILATSAQEHSEARSRPIKAFLQRRQRSLAENPVDRTLSLTANLSKNQIIQQQPDPTPMHNENAKNLKTQNNGIIDDQTHTQIRRHLDYQARKRRKRSIYRRSYEGKGKGGDSKIDDKGKGKGGDDKGKGKGSEGKGGSKKGGSKGYPKGKGKGGDKGGSKAKGGSSKGNSPKICEKLDFRDYYYERLFGKRGMGSNSKGSKAKTRRDRKLQFGGENCSPNVLETARQNPDLSIFVDAIEKAGLGDIFDCAGPFTVLAPTNEAFQKNPALLEFLLSHPNKLQQFLLYHIVPGFFPTRSLQPGPLETLLGENVLVSLDPTRFNQAEVVDPDNLACNGVINTIDDLLIPPDSGILPDVCNLLDFRQPGQFPVADTTVASPTGSNLLNHFVHNNRRLQYDGELCNPNMYSVALNNPDTSEFAALLKAAGLEDIFLCAGPFTVLAPSNEAINAIDPALLKELLLPANMERLQQLLLYHIIPGYLPTSELTAGPVDTLLNNEQVQVSLNPVKFNQAGVVEPDVMGCNGVMQVIDDVLVPNNDFCSIYDFSNRRRLQNGGAGCSTNVLDTARNDPDLTDIVALIDASGLAPVFDCGGPFTALLPTNEALKALDPQLLDALLKPENLPELQDLILYHILPGATLSTDFQAGPHETLLQGANVDVSLNPLMFDDANVVEADIQACNGYIDKIDHVLMPFPQPASAAPSPVASDICPLYTFKRRRLQGAGQDCSPNMLETARNNPDLSTIVSLFEAAGFENIFSCPGPFTGFFPTNEAFAALDPQILQFLTDPANVDALRGLLLYHLSGGENTVADLATGAPKEVDTLLPDETLQIAPTTNSTVPVTVNGAQIIDPDINACNGIIQVINQVLIPGPAATNSPTIQPTVAPIVPGSPTGSPVVATAGPSAAPAVKPAPTPATAAPSIAPIAQGSPTKAPAVATAAPTKAPAVAPVATAAPTAAPAPGATPAPAAPPTAAPVTTIVTTAPTTSPIPNTRRIQNYYIAYNSKSNTAPTETEYAQVFQNTADYYDSYFQTYWSGNSSVQFVNVTITPGETAFGVPGKPPIGGGSLNIYMGYNFSDFVFAPGSAIPSYSEIFTAMGNAIKKNAQVYIPQYVHPVGGPFGTVVAVGFGASDVAAPAAAPV